MHYYSGITPYKPSSSTRREEIDFKQEILCTTEQSIVILESPHTDLCHAVEVVTGITTLVGTSA